MRPPIRRDRSVTAVTALARVALARSTLALAALALAALAPSALGAQQVRGRVIDDATGEPLRGAIVILLATDGRRLAGALSDDDGRYAIRAPAAGAYALRVDLVGFRSATMPPFDLADGETLERSPRIHLARVVLPALRVTADARCGTPDSSNALAATLWAEARKVLDATRIAQSDRLLLVSVSTFRRDLTRDSVVSREVVRQRTGVTDSPFLSLPPDSLARVGHRIVRGDSAFLVAPDAAVLLSDVFVARHCFQAVRGPRARRDLVGLAFRPERRTPRVDVEGTLWLDTARAELRRIDFRFVAAPQPLTHTGDGFVEFARAPSGSWLVSRWRVRVPDLRVERRADAIRATVTDTTVVGWHDDGGEVIAAVPRGSALAAGPAAAGPAPLLTGVVLDSTTLRPLAGADVRLQGTGWRARADADGRFAFDSLLQSGSYVVEATHPRADSLGLEIPTRVVRLERGRGATVHLALPPSRALAAQLCPAPAEGAQSFVTGVVRDEAGGMPLAGVLLTAIWRVAATSGGVTETRVRGRTTATNAEGRYALCDVPLAGGASILVHRDGRVARAEPIGRGAAPAVDALARDFVVPRDIAGALIDLRDRTGSRLVELARDSVVRPQGERSPPGGYAELYGVILGPAGEVVEGASVAVVPPMRVDTGGTFDLRGAITGKRELRVRALGYAELVAPLRLASDQLLFVAVPLARAVPRLAATRVRGARDSAGTDRSGFEERRRQGLGTFLDRAAIERRGAVRVTDLLRGIAGVTIQPSLAHPGETEVIMGRSAVARPDCNTGRLPGGPPADTARRRSPASPEVRPRCPSADDPSAASGSGAACPVRFYVDGLPVEPGPGGIDAEVRPGDVEAIEVYRGSATIPPEFARLDTRCGVVVVWTRGKLRSRD